MSNYFVAQTGNPFIAGQYSRVHSLGMDCRPRHLTRQLELGCRRGPFDWIGGRSVADLDKALQTRCKEVLLLENLEPYEPDCKEYRKYADRSAGYLSAHDFAIENHDLVHEYPVFREKFDGICNRFFSELAELDSVLFFLSVAMEENADWQFETPDEILANTLKLKTTLEQVCPNAQVALLVATFHDELVEQSRPGLAFTRKYTFDNDEPWMEGQELIHWSNMLVGVNGFSGLAAHRESA
ncbi:DUF1796 family putative cysteine peptidase [Pseudoalteromonas rubra]|uniref:DUF1796 family putative cysteine peptidase n=1 Tax=Pseudoalteromonas rubra TaxID=43658 RepID=UPI002DBCEC40|nr:DUF1796 family putative cysteine peptidase [Pseudoalteromonas rubra]MEC4088023.1 DUF1796 family putative cysteine peptidase [Pseudoalteromonas rubra]